MKAKTFFSTQFLDAEAIIDSFTEQGLGEVPEASLGVLYCESSIEYEALVQKLGQKVSFPIIGGTTMDFPVENRGEDYSAILMVIAKESMRFSVQVSDKLDGVEHTEQMNELYAQGRSQLGEDPKLVMIFLPLMPHVRVSNFIDDIFASAGDIPVFGGVSTSDLISTKAAVFYGGEVYREHMVLLMLGGDIKPVCASANQVTPMVEYAPVVTEAKGNEVLRVDSSTFCDYMREAGIRPEDRVSGVDALMQYGPIPVIVDSAETQGTDVPEIRCISYTDPERGSAIFSASVQEGSKIYMSILRKQDVADSVADCLHKLEERMKPAQQEGYTYSAFFCVTCVARYFVQVGGTDVEGKFLAENVPEGCVPIGYYAFCEIGPTYRTTDGVMENKSHSASITMCAF